MHRSCPLVPANGISKSPGHLKIPNLNSKLRGNICFKYSRFEEKDSNIRIIFGLKNCRIRIRIFEIRGKRFESESNPNIFDHLCITTVKSCQKYVKSYKYFFILTHPSREVCDASYTKFFLGHPRKIKGRKERRWKTTDSFILFCCYREPGFHKKIWELWAQMPLKHTQF